MRVLHIWFQLSILLFLLNPVRIQAAEGVSFISYKTPYLLISDPHRQAEVWATCHAAYDIVSAAMKIQSPAQSDQFHQMANGAKIAIMMAYVSDAMKDMDDKNPNASISRFNAALEYGKTASKSMPETKNTALMAIFEAADEQQKTQWFADLGATINGCVENLEGQQLLIDMSRNLATSGLFQKQ